jgi:hypothetical protein
VLLFAEHSVCPLTPPLLLLPPPPLLLLCLVLQGSRCFSARPSLARHNCCHHTWSAAVPDGAAAADQVLSLELMLMGLIGLV